MLNPFRNWIVGNPWEYEEGDVADIGYQAFATCLKAIGITAAEHRTTSVLLYGEPGSGKTHLIRRIRAHIAARQPAAGPRPIFIYIRLSTSANMIWRHIRRRLADDLLRPFDNGRAQLHSFLMRRLAMAGSRGRLLDSWKLLVADGAPLDTNAFAVALEAIVNRISPAEREKLEIFDQMDGERDLPWPLRQVLRHVAHQRYPELTADWLRGDWLPEEHLTRLGIAEEDFAGDPEDRARRMVLALAQFAGPDSPIALCLDQLEALETAPGDHAGFAALARAVSTLHDETRNLVLVSCVQTSYRDVLRRFQSDFARISEYEGHLPPLDRDQAARLLQSRRAAISGSGPANGASRLWPLEESDLNEIFDRAGLASARRILSEASKKFDRIESLPEPRRDTLESEWRRRLDEASRAIADADVDEILDHGIKSLVRVKGDPWSVSEGSGDIEFALHGPSGDVEISLCNQESMRSLSARLKRLVSYQEDHLSKRVVILRDPRLPISKGAAAAREHLEEASFAGARLIYPSLEALAALEALRRLLADAQSGDLTADGVAIRTEAVIEWQSRHLTVPLQGLLEELYR